MNYIGQIMEIWCDSANKDLITKYLEIGINGITTNPKLLNLQNSAAELAIQKLLSIPYLPIAVQLTASNPQDMLKQALLLRDLSGRIHVKVPVTEQGITVIARLIRQSVPVIATCVFSSAQALMAFRLGVEYVAPYVSKMQKETGKALASLAQMQTMIDNYGFKTKILAASVHDLDTITELACMNIAAMTLSPGCLDKWLATHPATHQSIIEFERTPELI